MCSYYKNGVKNEKVSEEMNLMYKKKYRMLKKLVKRYVYQLQIILITIIPQSEINLKRSIDHLACEENILPMHLENAALCDQVFRLQEKMIGLKEERIYLLKKVYQFESSAIKHGSDSNESSQNYLKSQMSQSLPKSSGKKKTDPFTESAKIKSKKGMSGAIKRKTLVPVPVDSSGLPVFPVNLGSLSVHSLGEIITDRLTFHDEDLIYPVGFCSTRVYGSLSDPTSPCIYTCMILDGGTTPIFEVASDTDLETSISGDDINAVHSELLKRINQVVGVEVVNTRGRGADFFGISHPTVMNLLQSSPGIKKCIKYKMTKFEINRSGEPYVEENDASLRFESLQRSLAFARSHLEDMDRQETLDSTTTLRGLLGNS